MCDFMFDQEKLQINLAEMQRIIHARIQANQQLLALLKTSTKSEAIFFWSFSKGYNEDDINAHPEALKKFTQESMILQVDEEISRYKYVLTLIADINTSFGNMSKQQFAIDRLRQELLLTTSVTSNNNNIGLSMFDKYVRQSVIYKSLEKKKANLHFNTRITNFINKQKSFSELAFYNELLELFYFRSTIQIQFEKKVKLEVLPDGRYKYTSKELDKFFANPENIGLKIASIMEKIPEDSPLQANPEIELIYNLHKKFCKFFHTDVYIINNPGRTSVYTQNDLRACFYDLCLLDILIVQLETKIRSFKQTLTAIETEEVAANQFISTEEQKERSLLNKYYQQKTNLITDRAELEFNEASARNLTESEEDNVLSKLLNDKRAAFLLLKRTQEELVQSETLKLIQMRSALVTTESVEESVPYFDLSSLNKQHLELLNKLNNPSDLHLTIPYADLHNLVLACGGVELSRGACAGSVRKYRFPLFDMHTREVSNINVVLHEPHDPSNGQQFLAKVVIMNFKDAFRRLGVFKAIELAEQAEAEASTRRCSSPSPV